MQKKVFYGRDYVDYIKKSMYMVNVYPAGELYTAKNKHKHIKKKKKMWEGSTTSIIVKWTLNFKNIYFNIHSLLNENIKCMKLSMADDWLTRIQHS